MANPLKWRAEKPHLYKLTVGLYQGDVLLEQVQQTWDSASWRSAIISFGSTASG